MTVQLKTFQGVAFCLSLRLMVVALACCPALTGCVTLHSLLPDHKEKPPEGKVMQIATGWENQIAFLPDPINQGKPTPCLVGRLYLFCNGSPYPIVAEGKVTVQMLRNDMVGPDGQPLLLEQWNLPSEQLKQMISKDMIGWGYNLALPSATYHPGLTNFTVSVCFTPREGYPMYSRSKVNIKHQDRQFSPGPGMIVPATMKKKAG